MGSKIFISWSGELSKELGEALKDWIPKVLQTVKPYFTPDDIEKGAKWAKEIGQELSTSQVGIICLTQENQHNPWILFESGALSKNLEESKVCPLLFNFDTIDLKGPLSNFQATKFNKEDIKKLLESINNTCEESKLDSKNLDETFEVWWPKLEDKIKRILSSDKNSPKVKKRTDRDILEEILELSRSNAKSIMSDELRVSKMTVMDLVHYYRLIKDRLSDGLDARKEVDQMETVLLRLCKESGFSELFIRRLQYNSSNLYRTGNEIAEKNSGTSKIYAPFKNGNENDKKE